MNTAIGFLENQFRLPLRTTCNSGIDTYGLEVYVSTMHTSTKLYICNLVEFLNAPIIC